MLKNIPPALSQGGPCPPVKQTGGIFLTYEKQPDLPVIFLFLCSDNEVRNHIAKIGIGACINRQVLEVGKKC